MHVPSSSPQQVAEAAMSLPQSTSLVVSLWAAWRSRLQLQQINTAKELEMNRALASQPHKNCYSNSLFV